MSNKRSKPGPMFDIEGSSNVILSDNTTTHTEFLKAKNVSNISAVGNVAGQKIHSATKKKGLWDLIKEPAWAVFLTVIATVIGGAMLYFLGLV